MLIMIFICQKDSYLKELVTEVLSCAPVVKGKDVFCYEVILKDTVLFPEGGGQPCDFGTLSGIPVLNVRRENGQAIHMLPSPVKVEDNAVVTVDWARRFDHMQQHTGQHLITALAENIFNFHTTSWNLGVDESYIELDAPDVNIYQVQQLEQVVNEMIRERVPVRVHYYDKGDPALSEVRSRMELPEDHDGQIRVVTINGIDSNTCCGTHVKNLSELQVIKLLYAEKGKKNKTNLFFVAGERLLKYTRKCVSREKQLTQLLGCCPEEHHIHVKHLQKSLKIADKNAQYALRDVASLEAKLFNLQKPPPPYYFLHRKNAESDFISVFLNEAKSAETLFFLTVGDSKAGHVTISGPLPLVEKYGPQVCSILEGKGVIKNGRYHGKVKKLSRVPEAEKLLISLCDEDVKVV